MPISKSDLIELVLCASVRPLDKWAALPDPPHLGTEFAENIDRLERRRNHLFQTIRDTLSKRDLSWFEGRYGFSGDALDEKASQEQSLWRKEAAGIVHNISPWTEAALGRKEYLADFQYWGKAQYFSLIEVTQLSLGLEPNKVFEDQIAPTSHPPKQPNYAMDFASRRHELVIRKFDPRRLNWRVKRQGLVDWVREVELDVHPGFAEMLAKLSGSTSSYKMLPETLGEAMGSKAACDEPREVGTMAKLLVAIAISEFGYDPKSRRSPIPAEIEKLADLRGVSVSKETVLKYLRMGSEYLPDDWEPPQ